MPSTCQYKVPSFWPDTVDVWSKCFLRLGEFPNKSSKFGLLFGHMADMTWCLHQVLKIWPNLAVMRNKGFKGLSDQDLAQIWVLIKVQNLAFYLLGHDMTWCLFVSCLKVLKIWPKTKVSRGWVSFQLKIKIWPKSGYWYLGWSSRKYVLTKLGDFSPKKMIGLFCSEKLAKIWPLYSEVLNKPPSYMENDSISEEANRTQSIMSDYNKECHIPCCIRMYIRPRVSRLHWKTKIKK